MQVAALAYSLGADGLAYLREDSAVARLAVMEALDQAPEIAFNRVTYAVNKGFNGK